ncbi:MAG: adenosylcobinamide-GDP ribazoletransferase [Candidatus Omnitrophica bacterium]|nr:adenosylcobinamide-GDP ribazoletransferase [Candidatus Omnitrophota bacterium]
MNSLIAAFQFLTIFPFCSKKEADETAFARSVRYFPIVGIALAAILSLAYLLIRTKFSDMTGCLMVVTLLVMLTKGLHLDGLSDSFDALLSGRSREDMLAIMKDHHSGALGTAALVLVLLLKVFLLSEIFEFLKIPALFLALAGARSAMSLLLGNLPYLRGSEGLGYVFQKDLSSKDWMIAVGIGAVVAVAAFQLVGIGVFVLGLATIYGFGLYVKHKLGGITGDILGAANEIGELAFLFWLRVFLN